MDMNAGIHKHVIRTNLPARYGSFRKISAMVNKWKDEQDANQGLHERYD